MSLWWLSGALFLVGVLEQSLSEYQNLVSVRLRILKTTIFAEINFFIDFGVSIVLFLLLYDFWDTVKEGNIDFKILIPYLVYIQGCVTGTWLALFVFTKQKQKKERQKKLQALEKARQKLAEIRATQTTEEQPDEVDEFEEEQSNEETKA